MARYQITNNQTGKVMTVEGDSPPSEHDADSLWGQYQQQQPQQAQQPQQQQQQQQQQGQNPSLGGFLSNLLKSAGTAAGGVVDAVTHPVQTVSNIGALATGIGNKLEAVPGMNIVGVDPGGMLNKAGNAMFPQANQITDNVLNDYKNRYGGVSNIGNTLYNDPVGAALDLSTVLDGVGLAGDVGKLGKLSKIADTVNPTKMANVPGSMLLNKLGYSGMGDAIQAPFKSGYKPDIAQAAQDLGVTNLPASALTNSNPVRMAEATASKGIFGQKILDSIANTHGQLNDIASNITNQVAQAPDLKSAGEIIQNNFQNFKDTFNKNKGDLYDNVPQDVRYAPANTSNTSQALQDIIDSKKNDISGNSNVGFYQNLLNNIQNAGKPEQNLSNILDHKGDPVTSATQSVGGLNFNHLKQTRTALGQKIGNFNDPVATGDKASLSKLYGALSQDMDATVQAANPEAGAAINKANQYYKENINKINGPLGKLIETSDPEKLVEKLVTPNSQTQISHVREILGDKGMEPLQNNFLNGLFSKSLGKDGNIDAVKLETNIKRYGEPTINTLLNPDQQAKLQQVRDTLGKVNVVRDSLKQGTKLSDGSQTGFLNNATLSSLLPFLNPTAAAIHTGGNFALSKLLSTAAGKKYVTAGAQFPKPVTATGNILKMAAQAGGKNIKYGQPFYRAQQAQN